MYKSQNNIITDQMLSQSNMKKISQMFESQNGIITVQMSSQS